jgi:predicted CXXCH cytochrome family protein
MTRRAVVAGLAVVAAMVTGCNASSRYEILSLFFDGVPPPVKPTPPESSTGMPAESEQPRKVAYGAHGPYAARLCNACHVTGAGNALILPRDQLCFHCHEFKLDKRYIHGPLASGGCLACHDPHGSQYRYFLVSESDSFCSRCHESLARVGVHAGVAEQCTSCHDAHMSAKEYLLR